MAAELRRSCDGGLLSWQDHRIDINLDAGLSGARVSNVQTGRGNAAGDTVFGVRLADKSVDDVRVRYGHANGSEGVGSWYQDFHSANIMPGTMGPLANEGLIFAAPGAQAKGRK